MSNTSTSETTSLVCANCGKEGSDVTNICNKCKSVMYCNAACKKKHRSKHKKQCERRVAELHDEKLFREPPPEDDDCPICMIRLPSSLGRTYSSCCGKMICCGCIHAVQLRAVQSRSKSKKGHPLCPFCRVPNPTTYEEIIKRYEKRIKLNDARAFYNHGGHYYNALFGLPQNRAKALELWRRAAELGYVDAYSNIGYVYKFGEGGVEVDEKKAIHYCELAAMGGCVEARYNLGNSELDKGNYNRALKHFMIAVVKDGNSGSMEIIKEMYMNGDATKDDYAKALRAYQAYLDEIKSVQRDEAAAFDDEYKYYESPF